MHVEIELKKILQPWGNYVEKDQLIFLYDNAHIKNNQLLELCKKHQIRILPNLFTEIPND